MSIALSAAKIVACYKKIRQDMDWIYDGKCYELCPRKHCVSEKLRIWYSQSCQIVMCPNHHPHTKIAESF